jgi:hypothetical protein
MVSVLASGVVECGFRSCRFSNEHIALRSKSKDWGLGIRIMCTIGTTCLQAECCFSQLPLTIQLRVLVWYKLDIISSNVICSRNYIA